MISRNNIPQKWRILILGVVFPGLLVGGLGVLYLQESRDKAVDACLARARSLCRAAGATQELCESHWKRGVLSSSDLAAWAEEGDTEKIFSVIPVAAAMTSIKGTGESSHDFKVPAFDPRNPDNSRCVKRTG